MPPFQEVLQQVLDDGWYVYCRALDHPDHGFLWRVIIEKAPVVPNGSPRQTIIERPLLDDALSRALRQLGFTPGEEMSLLPMIYNEGDWRKWHRQRKVVSLQLTEGQVRWLYDLAARAANNLQPGRPYATTMSDDFRALVESAAEALFQAVPQPSSVTPPSKNKTRPRVSRSRKPQVRTSTNPVNDPQQVDSVPPHGSRMGPSEAEAESPNPVPRRAAPVGPAVQRRVVKRRFPSPS